MKAEDLIQRCLTGEATAEEVAELDRLLADDAASRRRWIRETQIDTGLREVALERVSRDETVVPMGTVRSSRKLLLWSASVAALLLISMLGWLQFSSPPVVATLTSSEDAAWESTLPTIPGSDLTRGKLKLRSGIATVEFRSGVEVLLEAPAELILKTPMRGRLLAGSAVIDVPEEAIGFIMETPDGHAVDHGTKFSVSVDEQTQISAFEVLSGEISVHHKNSGESIYLTDLERITAGSDGLEQSGIEGEKGSLPSMNSQVRLVTTGAEVTIMRGGNAEEHTHPDFLMAKRSSFISDFDRRSLFSFDLSSVSDMQMESARLRLNLVPCGLGYAARLPEVSRFNVYGTAGPFSSDDLNWESAPQPEAVALLGSFTIPRSQLRGSFALETEVFADFIVSHAGEVVTFILTRKTDEALGNGLVHAFASSSHPEASGPTLEID